MSHVTVIRTQMVEQRYLRKALEDVGWSCQLSGATVIASKRGQSMRFEKRGQHYAVIGGDGVRRGVSTPAVLNELTNRYAYHATMDQLERQGFKVAKTETHENGEVRLVLRRMA